MFVLTLEMSSSKLTNYRGQLVDIVTDQKKLRKPAKLVKEGEDIAEIADALLNELKGRNAWGLSANQFGYDRQVLVMKVSVGPPVCVVNPSISKERGSQVRTEHCLCLPGETIEVKRPQQIVLKGINRYFKPVKYRLSGIYARTACHEVDHLNGILITDKGKEE